MQPLHLPQKLPSPGNDTEFLNVLEKPLASADMLHSNYSFNKKQVKSTMLAERSLLPFHATPTGATHPKRSAAVILTMS